MFDYFHANENEQYLFLQLPLMLIKDDMFKNLSSDAKILYSLLLNRTSLSAKNGWADEHGRVYIIYTQEEIMSDLNCWANKANKCMKQLKEIGLVKTIRRGLGKPNIIYVMNFATVLKHKKKAPKGQEEPQKDLQTLENTKKFQNGISGTFQREYPTNSQMEFQKLPNGNAIYIESSQKENREIDQIEIETSKSKSKSKSKPGKPTNETIDMTTTADAEASTPGGNEKGIKTDKVKTDKLKTDELKTDMKITINADNHAKGDLSENIKRPPFEKTPVISATQGDQPSNDDDYITYLGIIQENIEYNFFKVHKPTEVELVDELVNCMLDVILTEGSKVKINGELKSRAMVTSQYLKLTSMDIEHVITRYKAQRHTIKQPHAYLKTMLYTIKQECGHFYENATRVDGVI